MDWSQLLKDFAEAIPPALNVLLESALVYLVARGAAWLNHKYQSNRTEDLDLLILVGVKAAEQIYGAKKGEEKKRYVLGFVQAEAEKLGLKIDMFTLSAKVEAAVMDEFNFGRQYQVSG